MSDVTGRLNERAEELERRNRIRSKAVKALASLTERALDAVLAHVGIPPGADDAVVSKLVRKALEAVQR